jgi:hypothetical protein
MSKCIWKLGSPCQGKVKNANVLSRGIFATGLEVYVCEGHGKEHDSIIELYRAGYDIENILQMSADKIKELLTTKENENEVIDN